MAKTALTDRKVQSLKAADKGKRYQVMDAQVPGFGVRVTDMGVKTCIFQARFPGSANPARREINEATLEKARDKAREWSTLVKQGVDPAQVEAKAREDQAQTRANTFAAVSGDYFARKLVKQRSGESVRKRIESNLIPIFEDKPIAEMTDLDILGKVEGDLLPPTRLSKWGRILRRSARLWRNR
jgi:Arm DNA-binding domain